MAGVPVARRPGAGLQFGLQFTVVRPGSAEYAPPGRSAARTAMNPRELTRLKLLIRGFELQQPSRSSRGAVQRSSTATPLTASDCIGLL